MVNEKAICCCCGRELTLSVLNFRANRNNTTGFSRACRHCGGVAPSVKKGVKSVEVPRKSWHYNNKLVGKKIVTEIYKVISVDYGIETIKNKVYYSRYLTLHLELSGGLKLTHGISTKNNRFGELVAKMGVPVALRRNLDQIMLVLDYLNTPTYAKLMWFTGEDGEEKPRFLDLFFGDLPFFIRESFNVIE